MILILEWISNFYIEIVPLTQYYTTFEIPQLIVNTFEILVWFFKTRILFLDIKIQQIIFEHHCNCINTVLCNSCLKYAQFFVKNLLSKFDKGNPLLKD